MSHLEFFKQAFDCLISLLSRLLIPEFLIKVLSPVGLSTHELLEKKANSIFVKTAVDPMGRLFEKLRVEPVLSGLILSAIRSILLLDAAIRDEYYY